ncbi:MAG: PHB depolymerase family esterase [Planctomycetota bacterium]
MNRIKISPLATRPFDESDCPSISIPGLATDSKPLFELDGQTAPDLSDCCFFVPLHYEKNYSYPLVVWLHNNGEDAEQIQRIMPQLSLQNYVAIAPQAAVGNRHCGYYWEQDQNSIDFAADSVLAAIDNARCRTQIASNRIFIAGCGAAGTMAYRVALTHPDLFAGVASINGPLPEGDAPLGRWSSSRNIEVFWSHFRKSKEFEQNQLCRQLKLLHVAGFSVTLRQYPGNGDNPAPAFPDLNRWIMQMIDSTVS